MKLGIDMHHGFLQETMSTEKAMEKAKREGFDGVYYKLPVCVSANLDRAELQAAADCARDLGLYIDFGIGRVNPYNTNETPEAWTVGGGDYKRAVEKMLEAAAFMGSKELIGVTAGWKGQHTGYYVNDRFRTDVTWDEQLRATARFLKSLAPALRDTGTRINLETHEEITSIEILRLIEEIGDDVLGVAFDTANVVSRAEDPVSVAHRTAPYVHQMHAKDCILYFSDTGLVRQVKPAGEGIVNFREIFSILAPHKPDLHVQLEDHKGLMVLDLYVKEWLDSHPDLTVEEVSILIKHAWHCQQRIASGELPDPKEYEIPPYAAQRDERLKQSTSHLSGVLREMGLRA